MAYLMVLTVGLMAGVLSGIIGTGSSMMLMPVLVILYGPQQAVPIMAIASILGNLGKVLSWWREIDWRACIAYAVTAVPGAMLGVRTLLALPSRTVDLALGVFFMAMVPTRRWLARRSIRFSLFQLSMIGAVVGFLTGIVVSTGPITVPVFMNFGLVKGAFLATEAAASLAVYGAKVASFREAGALPPGIVAQGLITGASIMAGTFCARGIVARMSANAFRLVVDALMLSSGLTLLWAASR
ncbi:MULTISPECIES: sulfite exporter TauE/SafE family protein [unclassified Caballeronia]|uniref:sulfite exporter TauE/SafE family protein n=1 Tax=unclassified Caballeronia TaxID=2646786 RepID=UPI0028638801|nr:MULTISPECIES: sulfite exporter TauE/SafE family protein [unclassified Caballeronia]MDR5741324.1 sulfite exporter TauE/SafE family protein [Caballeronia sp. LZ016]MDR5807221.1 sulfite exporter TauE/SafE family protein [Caballeronia sp. LZ019]